VFTALASRFLQRDGARDQFSEDMCACTQIVNELYARSAEVALELGRRGMHSVRVTGGDGDMEECEGTVARELARGTRGPVSP